VVRGFSGFLRTPWMWRSSRTCITRSTPRSPRSVTARRPAFGNLRPRPASGALLHPAHQQRRGAPVRRRRRSAPNYLHTVRLLTCTVAATATTRYPRLRLRCTIWPRLRGVVQAFLWRFIRPCSSARWLVGNHHRYRDGPDGESPGSSNFKPSSGAHFLAVRWSQLYGIGI